MKNHKREKTIYGLWPEIVETYNREQGTTLPAYSVKYLYYIKNDAAVVRSHTEALERRKKEVRGKLKAVRENRKVKAAVLRGMGKVMKQSNFANDVN